MIGVGIAGTLAFAFFIAMLVERVTQFVIKPLLAIVLALFGQEEAVAVVIPFVTAILGAALSLGFGVDLFADAAGAAGLAPAAWLTLALTAIVLAGGSNLLHDLWPGGSGEEG